MALWRGRAEHSLARAVALDPDPIAVFGVTFPSLPSLFPAAAVARTCAASVARRLFAAAGYQEPSLIFWSVPTRRIPDGAGAADFLYPAGAGSRSLKGAGTRLRATRRRDRSALHARYQNRRRRLFDWTQSFNRTVPRGAVAVTPYERTVANDDAAQATSLPTSGLGSPPFFGGPGHGRSCRRFDATPSCSWPPALRLCSR